MKQEHTATPWAINDVNTSLVYSEKTALNLARAFGENKEANARRIVAAVNACEGIETEILEAGTMGEIGTAIRTMDTENERLRQQNAELVQALKKLSLMAQTSGGTAGSDKALIDAIEQAASAINKHIQPASMCEE